MNIFDCTTIDGGIRRDHHFTASVLAIAKGDEEAAAVVLIAIGAKREWATMQPRKRNEHSHQITGFAQKFQMTIGERCDVGCRQGGR